jgi:general secretion pathway protein G
MTMTRSLRQSAARGFTLIELLIVVIIIAILAAIAIPQFSNTSNDAEDAQVDANLNTVRSAVELYRIQHNNVYPSAVASTGAPAAPAAACAATAGAGAINTAVAFTEQLTQFSDAAGHTCSVAGGAFVYGPYIRAIPAEPISNPASAAIAIVTDAAAVAPAAVTPGWRFNNVTGIFQMNSNATARDQRLYSAH